MNRITTARIRLDAAAGLPATLDAAYDAFESILAVLRHHQENAGHAFPAFVLAAAAAANGRDQVAGAPALSPPAAPPGAAGDVPGPSGWAHAAAEAAALSHELVSRLLAAAGTAGARDQAACQHAAARAARIWSLLAGASKT